MIFRRAKRKPRREVPAGFTYYFPRIHLLLSAAWLLMGIVILFVVVLAREEARLFDPRLGLVVNLALTYAPLLAALFVLLALLILVASLGFLRRQSWAHTTWLVICWLEILLLAACLGAEVYWLIRHSAWQQASASASLVLSFCVFAIGSSALTLRRLASPSTKSYFGLIRG